MPAVYFTFTPPHSKPAPTLHIDTGADQITWGYGLNAVAFPTYGGEVVQALSIYIDDLKIQGTVRTYAKAEEIYRWFVSYLKRTTQTGQFQDYPVQMYYPERGWKLNIKPTQIPAFTYGTEVVAPQWQLQAAVVEPDNEQIDLTMAEATKRGFDFNRLHAGIGYAKENPFTDPAAAAQTYDLQQASSSISDFYTKLIPSYLDGNFDDLNQGYQGSKPAQPKKSNQSNQKGNAGGGSGSQNNGAPAGPSGPTAAPPAGPAGPITPQPPPQGL